MILLGIFVIAADTIMDTPSPSLLICYMSSVMIGFSFISLESVGKENTTRWIKHKLTAPVTRSDIVKSLYLSLLIWLAAGIIFAGIGVTLSVALHGFPFDRDIDVFMLYVVGIGISLFMGALFFPLLLLAGEERSEVCLIISILCGIGIIIGISSLINSFFPKGMTTGQSLISGMALLACAALAFGISCLLTVHLFRRKEY